MKEAGARIGCNFSNYGNVDKNHAFLLTIGDNVTLASGCRIILHDASTKNELGYSNVGIVEIGDNVFIGANAIVLPNVNIGSNVIVGAGSVICRDVQDNSVVVGNPGKYICSYDEYI